MTTTMLADEEVLKKLEDVTKEATRHQHEVLESILQRNGGAHYLQAHLQRSNAPLDAATFRRVVPLSAYKDYSEHINKLAEGPVGHASVHGPLLSADPLGCFFFRYSSSSSSSFI